MGKQRAILLRGASRFDDLLNPISHYLLLGLYGGLWRLDKIGRQGRMHHDVSIKAVMFEHFICAGDYGSVFSLLCSSIFIVEPFKSLNMKLKPGLTFVFLDL